MLGVSAAAANAGAADNPTALARAGTKAIESRRFGDALEAFTRAADLNPADPGPCFGAAVAAFMLGQDEMAENRFQCALARDPAFVPAMVWLGDLYYRSGRLAEAIAVYEAARQRSPEDRELQRQVGLWREEQRLQSRFHHSRSEHFTVRFEADADEPLARQVVAQLEVAYARVGRTLGVYPSRPITVLLYSRTQFTELTRLADWTVAAYDGQIRVPIVDALEDPKEIDRVVSHEFVHAVVTMLGGRTVPAWLNEGLASVLEPAGADELEATLTRSGGRAALSKLHGSFTGLSKHEAEIAYASAAQGVRLLIELRNVGAIVALLEDLGHGMPFDRAFRLRIGMPYQDFAARIGRE
jgi:tetratricopeptide (TPR) repeat protein